MIKLHTLVKRKSDFISSEIDGNTVMMSIEEGKYYGMNTVASDIWNLLENPIMVSEMIGLLSNQYDIDAQQCEKEVFNFLATLLENHLIEIETA